MKKSRTANEMHRCIPRVTLNRVDMDILIYDVRQLTQVLRFEFRGVFM